MRPQVGHLMQTLYGWGRDSSPTLWTWFIVQLSLEAIILLHVMGMFSKSMMGAVPLIFNPQHDSYSFKILGRSFLSDNTGCVYS